MLNLANKFFLPCLALVALASPSFAVNVKYNTTGSAFSCNLGGANGSALTLAARTNNNPFCTIVPLSLGKAVRFTGAGANNQATLTYTPFTSPTGGYDVAPGGSTNAGFGSYTWSGSTTAFLGKTTSRLADFILQVNESNPTFGGNGAIQVGLLGNIRRTLTLPTFFSGGMKVNFAGENIVINSVTYTPDLVRPNAGGSVTSGEGLIEIAAVVPEPGFYGLLSLGMAGLYVAVRRRRTATV